MDDENDAPRPAAYGLGEDLSRRSVAELERLRAACLAEAARIDAEIARKRATQDAADAFFKKPG